jgi:hypothetical protein
LQKPGKGESIVRGGEGIDCPSFLWGESFSGLFQGEGQRHGWGRFRVGDVLLVQEGQEFHAVRTGGVDIHGEEVDRHGVNTITWSKNGANREGSARFVVALRCGDIPESVGGGAVLPGPGLE